jgi:hypothetical protein
VIAEIKQQIPVLVTMCIQRLSQIQLCWSKVSADHRPVSFQHTARWITSQDCQQEWEIDGETEVCPQAIQIGQQCLTPTPYPFQERSEERIVGSYNIQHEFCTYCERDNILMELDEHQELKTRQGDMGAAQMATSTGAFASTPILIDDQEARTNQQELSRLQESLRRAEERMRPYLRRAATVHQQESNAVGNGQPSIQLAISSNGTAEVALSGSHRRGSFPDQPIAITRSSA